MPELAIEHSVSSDGHVLRHVTMALHFGYCFTDVESREKLFACSWSKEMSVRNYPRQMKRVERFVCEKIEIETETDINHRSIGHGYQSRHEQQSLLRFLEHGK